MRILIPKQCKSVQPLHVFMEDISEGLRTKIFAKFQSFAEYGDIIHGNSLKSLSSRIWKYKGTIHKLRVDHGKESARVLFTRYGEGDLILVHAFLKSTRKTPKKEACQAISVLEALPELEAGEWVMTA